MRFYSLVAAAALLSACLTAEASPILYNVNNTFSTFSVTGTITTDGNTGNLQTSDITGYNLLLMEGPKQLTLTTANSQVALFGAQVLSATLSGLFVNYDLAGDFLLQSPTIGANQNFLCYQGTGRNCYSNGSLGSEGININGASGVADVYALQSGTVQIASAAVATTPEPSSLVLLGTGVLGVVGVLKRRLA